ncbi:MAG: hypothetical protein Q7T71_11415, partial [Herbiconiux sp.]|nr:hypothetical protein [Herbiconiux sp.]
MPRTVTPPRGRRRPRAGLAGAIVIPAVVLLALSGCVGAAEAPQTPVASSTSAPVPTGSPAPVTSSL